MKSTPTTSVQRSLCALTSLALIAPPAWAWDDTGMGNMAGGFVEVVVLGVVVFLTIFIKALPRRSQPRTRGWLLSMMWSVLIVAVSGAAVTMWQSLAMMRK